jgi:hypothetical protein
MTKTAGSGSGSISQRHGSADPDPDPPQNVMDPEHWSTGSQSIWSGETVPLSDNVGWLNSPLHKQSLHFS